MNSSTAYIVDSYVLAVRVMLKGMLLGTVPG